MRMITEGRYNTRLPVFVPGKIFCSFFFLGFLSLIFFSYQMRETRGSFTFRGVLDELVNRPTNVADTMSIGKVFFV